MKNEGNIVVKPRVQAELLNSYYAPVFTRSENPSLRLKEYEGETLAEITIMDEV